MSPTIADLGEHPLIRRLTRHIPKRGKYLIRGIGDDAAVIRPEAKKDLVVTTDMLVEGIHFRHAWSAWREIGRKAMEVNLSDLAAMGALPRYALVALAMPRRTSVRAIRDLYQGMLQALRPYQALLIGGDTNESLSGQGGTIAVTMMGTALRKPLPARSRARGGDGIYVTGVLGWSALGLVCLKEGVRGKKYQKFLCKHRVPQARVLLGNRLCPMIHAMIDVSDGLLADLHHVLAASRKGAILWSEDLPGLKGMRAAARQLKQDPLALALTGGEDYELLFTASPRHERTFVKLGRRYGVNIVKIGKIQERRGVQLLDSQGKKIQVRYKGFEHFTT